MFQIFKTCLLIKPNYSLEYIDRLFDGDAHTPRDDVEAAVPETEYKPEMDHIERLAPVKE
jgi:hypothetical protein